MKASILDPKFKYVPAANTDIRQTFARVRREIEEAKKEQEAKVKVLKEKGK